MIGAQGFERSGSASQQTSDDAKGRFRFWLPSSTGEEVALAGQPVRNGADVAMADSPRVADYRAEP